MFIRILMRFEKLPPSVLERLGLDDEAEAAQKFIFDEAVQTSRIASITSLETAVYTAYEVVLPPSPVFVLLVAYFLLTMLWYAVSRLNAHRVLRRHDKVL
jgi:hypothetical protein